MSDWVTAIGASALPLGLLLAAIWTARRYALEGGEAAQSRLISTLQGLNSALTEENKKLREDLAGCESDNRRLLRLPHD